MLRVCVSNYRSKTELQLKEEFSVIIISLFRVLCHPYVVQVSTQYCILGFCLIIACNCRIFGILHNFHIGCDVVARAHSDSDGQ